MATQAFCRDCMEAMREFPDKFFDLAVVDPPYGISITGRHRSQTAHVERERERERETDAACRRPGQSVRR